MRSWQEYRLHMALNKKINLTYNNGHHLLYKSTKMRMSNMDYKVFLVFQNVFYSSF